MVSYIRLLADIVEREEWRSLAISFKIFAQNLYWRLYTLPFIDVKPDSTYNISFGGFLLRDNVVLIAFLCGASIFTNDVAPQVSQE